MVASLLVSLTYMGLVGVVLARCVEVPHFYLIECTFSKITVVAQPQSKFFAIRREL